MPLHAEVQAPTTTRETLETIATLLAGLGGSALLQSNLPRERAVGALLVGGSRIPGAIQQQRRDRQEEASRHAARRRVRAHLNQPIRNLPQPVRIPIGNDRSGSAVLDVPTSRMPTPQELQQRLGDLISDPAGAFMLEQAGLKVPAAAVSATKTRAQIARERRQAAQQLRQGKLTLLKEIRGQRLPQGTRRMISQAKSMDDLIDASAVIHGALSIENATPAKLAYAAAGGGPEAARAQKALSLLTPGETRATITQLAKQAAQGDAIAAKAIEILKELRGTGVRRQRGGGSGGLSSSLPPALDPLLGGGVQGRGTGSRPRVKSFKRLD